jgi:putative membrane protein
MVVPESYTYPRAALLGALTISLVIGLASTLVLKNESLRLFLLIFIPCLLLLNYLIARVKPVKRLFITGREMDEEVAEAAVASFYNNGLYKTRDETGILIYISIFEKRIWILADGASMRSGAERMDETVRIIPEA